MMRMRRKEEGISPGDRWTCTGYPCLVGQADKASGSDPEDHTFESYTGRFPGSRENTYCFSSAEESICPTNRGSAVQVRQTVSSPLYISAGYTVNVLPIMRMRRIEGEIHREIAGLVPVITAPLFQLAENCGSEPQSSRFESGKAHDPSGSKANETVLCISPQDIQSTSSS